jgi:Na+/H+ antiporter NhaD/arsenite permease-like protein
MGWLLPLPQLLAAVSADTEPGPARVLPMVLVGLVLAVTFAAIAFEWLHKSLAALLGAIAAVIIGLGLHVYGGERPYLAVHEFIAHDLNVIGVIVGTSILVEIASHSGLFHFLAVKLVKLTGGRPVLLLPVVMAATVGFVTFLTIAPGVLIMSSLVLVITKSLDDSPTPYIIALALAANSGALMTFASGIPTLMIGTAAGIPYVHFLLVSMPLALLSGVVAYGVVALAYRRHMVPKGDMEARRQKVAAFDEWALVKDRSLFYRAAVILALTILGFALAQQLGVGLDFIAFCGATAALLFSGFDPERAIRTVKWPIILFFVGLFVLVGTVRATGLLDVVAWQLMAIAGTSVFVALLLLVPFVFVTAGVVDNIPVAATMIPIVQNMVAGGFPAEPLWWSLIAACNLGGNPTPVGSIAAVIALHALERERGIRVGWGEYLRVGGLVTVLQIPLVIAYMELYRRLGLFPEL